MARRRIPATRRGLVNAAKHAPGQRVSVRLEYGGDDVSLTVVNDLPPSGGHVPGSVVCPSTVDAATG
ncbi:MAG TPA: hypothetical protein VG268_11085 [Streptosporangiaceae bacterium]|nr:hypothetical protein [Streptosporangiaceae bacterium]